MRLTSSRSFTRSADNAQRRYLNTRLSAGVFLCSLLLSACTPLQQTRTLQQEQPADLPARWELDQIPFFPQTSHQCGPAALATVLVAHNVDVQPDELTDQVYVPALRGSLAAELTATARRYGMLAYPLAPQLTTILAEVVHGHPVLVFQNLGLRWLPKWHFAVVVGYDLDTGLLVLRSGKTRRRQVPLATFERTWAHGRFQSWAILPAGRVPATAALKDYLQAVRELEQTSGTEPAQPAWLAATSNWPDSFTAWMAYGNSLYASDDGMPAVEAFRKATQLAPADPAGWNNLAYALARINCPRQAQRAACCAFQLAPEDSRFQQTLEEIAAHTQAPDSDDCPQLQCDCREDTAD